jgi:hypothetical protein
MKQLERDEMKDKMASEAAEAALTVADDKGLAELELLFGDDAAAGAGEEEGEDDAENNADEGHNSNKRRRCLAISDEF